MNPPILVYGINYQPEPTGISVYNTEMCEYLSQKGYSTLMVTAFPYYPFGSDFKNWYENSKGKQRLFVSENIQGVKILRANLYKPNKKIGLLRRVIHELSFVVSSFVRMLFLKHRYKVIICISPPLLLGLVSYAVSRIRRIPFIFHIQDLQPDAAVELNMIRNQSLAKILYKIEKFIYRKAAYVLTISEGMREKIIAKGIDPNKVKLFYDWADVEQIKPSPKDNKDYLRNVGVIACVFGIVVTMSILSTASVDTVEKWNVYEIRLEGPSSGNPYLEADLKAVFQQGETSITVPGFYDGDGIYRIRFSPNQSGEWSYATQSNQSALNNQKGVFTCIQPSGQNHGPVKTVNTYYLEFSDGTPFYSVGTTAYQWTSVKQSIQEQTINTLKNAPFNKIRMCVFPKWYDYGNKTEPWAYPFENINDFHKPNYIFFQNFDQRIRQLCNLGIQADVILFHPYDHWGYAAMGKENNERYVRYMIARISAYRNVWWSLANEWDVPKIKETIDWEGIGTLLQNEDPHNRFRGIHNWYDSEDHFYDHSKKWLTHISTQTSSFYLAEKWRNQYNKPLMFDEMRYEGDVSSRWGNMSGEQMTSYFWMAGLSGGYATHGDTFRNKADADTEVRWWGKGGQLPGTSPLRIAFFRKIMEQIPVKEMKPHLSDNGDPKIRESNIYSFSKEGEIYLAYTAEAGKEILLTLAGNKPYQFDLVDTWNMTVTQQKSVPAGVFSFKTTNPYQAVCLYVDNLPRDWKIK